MQKTYKNAIKRQKTTKKRQKMTKKPYFSPENFRNCAIWTWPVGSMRSGTRCAPRTAAGFVARGVAVAGWQWYQSIREVKAVRMVVVRKWQWQYWRSCDISPPKNQGKCFFFLQIGQYGVVFGVWQWLGEWQWQGGSGTNRFARSRRFEWCNFQRGSGSIGGVVTSPPQKNQGKCFFFFFCRLVNMVLCLQWQGGSGTNRCARSARFEWCNFQRGSGSIGSGTAPQNRAPITSGKCVIWR
jgi:hypothetical protein